MVVYSIDGPLEDGGCYAMIFGGILERLKTGYRWPDLWTDRRTDGLTATPSYREISRTHLKSL